MKRTINALMCIVLASLALSARGQVVPSATGRKLTITAGGMGSVFQPDYAGGLTALTSPNRLYGAGVYVDVRVSRWLQFEAEGRWLNFNQYYSGVPPTGNGESNYLAGYRLPFTMPRYTRIKPYGKVLVGFSTASFLSGHATTLAYGGGIDYRLNRRFTIRACDFEYQQWRTTPTLFPYGLSVGLGYKVF
jgi:hypothetical protein